MQPPPEGAEREELIRLTAEYIRDGIFSPSHPEEVARFRRDWYEAVCYCRFPQKC